MREQIKSLSQETLVYGLSTVVGRFLNFLLVPFYVNVLKSTAEYGMATSLYTYIAFLNVIFHLGLEGAYFRYGARAEGEPPQREKEKIFFSSAFIFIAAAAGFFTIILALLVPQAVVLVFHDRSMDITPLVPMLTKILWLAALILFIDSLTVIPFAVLRLEHQAWRFATIRLVGILLTLALNFIFIVGLKWGVRGIFVANLLASLAVFILLLPTIGPRLVWRVDRDILGKLIPFGLTNVPAYLSTTIVQMIDRPIVQGFLGLGMLGIYQANYRMGFIMMILVGLFEYAWRPFFMRQSLKDDALARRIFARVLTYFMLIALMTFLVLAWGLPYLVSTPIWGRQLFKEPYLVGLPIIPIILLAYIFQGMVTNFIAGIYIKERNKVLPWNTALGATISVGVNLSLVPRMGLMGAAVATLAATLTMAVLIFKEAQKVYPVPYEWNRIALLVGIIGAAYGLERILVASHVVMQYGSLIGLRVILFILAGLALFLFRFFSVGEKEFLRQVFFKGAVFRG